MNDLIAKRGGLKRQLTMFTKYVAVIVGKAEVAELDIIQLNKRTERLESLLNDFDEVQNKIESSVEDEQLEKEFEEREKFEACYYEQISLAEKLIKDYNKDSNSDRQSVISAQSLQVVSDSQSNQASHLNIKLPTIQLPKYDGQYSSWLEFRDTYKSLIHENESINNIQKFHYLRASLEGGAAQIIKSLEFTARNYQIAWDTLLDRYDNHRLLVHNHVKALFTIEPVSKESASALRKAMDVVLKNLRALEQLGQPTDNWDTLIVYMVTSKLDLITAREWENYKAGKEVPSLEDLKAFIKSRADLLETIQTCQTDKKYMKPNSTRGFLATGQEQYKPKCYICSKEHYIQNCSDFLKLGNKERRDKTADVKLCFNCLRPGHDVRACRRGTCKKCDKKHHTLLHNDEKPKTDDTTDKNERVSLSACASEPYVLLSTAYVGILDKYSNTHTVRAVLDSGSQSSYISQDLCKRLNLPTLKTAISVFGLNQTISKVEAKTEITIQSLHNNYSIKFQCLVLPQLTGKLPNIPVNVSDLNIPKNIKLADPTFFKPDKIDLLIGANLFWNIISIGQIPLGVNLPILQKTRFGWVVSGPIGQTQPSTTLCNFTHEIDIQNQLAKFWELEECVPTKALTKEETECEVSFQKHMKRSAEGRFIVSIPLKDSVARLGDSYQQAYRRFLALERKLKTKPNLKSQYIDFINEYKSLGHMSIVQNPHKDQVAYYMPHNCVIKLDSSTTPVRVVFDASAPSSTGYSLNDLQIVGPTLQSELISILLRFRQHQYVISGDISKMYRQVLIAPEQRCLQRILWRENPNDSIEVYELQTVTYGTAAASFLAIRCLVELAEENTAKFPKLAEIIKSDFYVDDMLTGTDDMEEAAQIVQGIANILKQGCFELRKLYSNNAEVLKYVADRDAPNKVIQFGTNENAKTLGLTWCPSTDSLMYRVSALPVNEKITKRTILSSIAQIFDPLGLLSPCIISAKMLMQQLWLEKLDWDEALPQRIHTFWSTFRNELPLLNNIKIPRLVICQSPKRVELHGFCDASEKAFGGCIYLRTENQLGDISVHLLASKTKVAPLKTVTLPRLELAGALVLARLADKVSKALRLKMDRRIFWSDSTIVISWLKLSPIKLKSFVSNRVSEVQELTASDEWRHVPSTENPADYLSRGVKPSQIQSLNVWWRGPRFLTEQESEWPKTVLNASHNEVPDIKQSIHTFLSRNRESNFPFNIFSKLNKIKRVVAWIFRFRDNSFKSKEIRNFGPLTSSEINAAFMSLIKIAQNESFRQEIHDLCKHKELHRKSRILSLNPYIDSVNILRVGGRLENSKFPESKKHPILLCSHHHLTKLIFENEHQRLLHTGPNHLLASVREQFWPVLGRNLAKRVVRQCVTCFRQRPSVTQPIMGQLPEVRLKPGPPFINTGVDYAGPFQIANRKGRGAKMLKCYIGLFICLSTKACHLELISDLSRDSFLMSLKRMMSRRGKPALIMSDNGSNFVAASSEIKLFNKFLMNSGDAIKTELAKDSIEWKFIPPYSPHFGGLWEAGVKTCKKHLKRVLGNAHLTFEEFNTLLVQIESIMNSRPLFPLSSDPTDLAPLTPGHFLIGRPLTALPERDYTEVPLNRLTRWQLVQQCMQHFWSRWNKEYISELQQRPKWRRNQSSIEEGTLCVIKEDNTPPLKWKLGRVVSLLPGVDGINRVAILRTSTGEMKRSFARICPLPKFDESMEARAVANEEEEVCCKPFKAFQGGGHVEEA